MAKRVVFFLMALAGMLGATRPAAAQEPSPELRVAAERVVALLKGEAQPDTVFSPSFLQAVPAAQVQAVREQLVGQNGAPRRVSAVTAQTPRSGTIEIEMERATVRMDLAIEAEPPHRLTGLLVTGVETRGDTPAAIAEALAALPGQTSLAIARLGDGPPEMIAGREPERVMAIGSTFKLFILAELSRQVQAGERRWSDVVNLDRRSLPSGMLQTWPAGSPLTLHTLASLMISISDNTATDMLLGVVGRHNVERMMTTIGVAAAARNRPFPGTLEMFALKTAPVADQQAWAAADEAGRRRLLDTRYGRTDSEAVDPAIFTRQPLRIGELEWFASASDLVRTMDWLRRNGDETARAILAISPGGPPQLRRDYAYIGYKGGSEPGVLSQTWLVQNRAGTWHAVTLSWNNPDATLDEARFFALSSRALQLIR